MQAVQSLGDNLSASGGVVKVNLVDGRPVSDGEDKGRRRGGRAELGDGGERRGHWSMRSASS